MAKYQKPMKFWQIRLHCSEDDLQMQQKQFCKIDPGKRSTVRQSWQSWFATHWLVQAARLLPTRHPRPCKRGTSWAPYARVVMIYLVVKCHRLLAVPKNLKLLLRKHWKSSKMHHFADTNRMETLIFLMEIPLHFGYYNNWTVID